MGQARNQKQSIDERVSIYHLALVEFELMSLDRSSSGKPKVANRHGQSTRMPTQNEIYQLYCTFGEHEHTGGDFLSKVLNILRESVEGLLSHGEVKCTPTVHSSLLFVRMTSGVLQGERLPNCYST